MAPLRTGNLPAELTSFVGRRHELAEIRRLFTSSSLVTLTGPGGVGKTRLVLRAAAGLTKAFPDGVWLVELGEINDPELIPQTVAEALLLRDQSGLTTLDSLVANLADRRLLLILDNCEHLVAHVAKLADTLRRSCPELRILATSREALGIEGETTIRVPPLAVPDPSQPVALKGLPQFDAVNLFAERAAAAQPDFEVTDANREAVLRIVQQLDGVPLALELAAARLRTLSPEELADRLADRYRVLTGGSRVAPARHQTLRMCVDWSYTQCTPLEQTLWNRISVFVGGFELDAVEGICAFGDLLRLDVLDLLASLVDKSIVTRIEAGDRARFRLLESLREYGLERLHESGEYHDVRQRHRDWFADLAVRSRAEWISRTQVTWTKRLDRELANIRAAFDYSVLEPEQSLVGLRLTESLHLYWVSRGLLTEGRRWLARSLADTADLPLPERVNALYSAVALAGMQGELAAAHTLLEQCQSLAAQLGEEHLRGVALHAAGVTALFEGDPRSAVKELQDATDVFRQVDDLTRLVEALIGLALAAGFSGENALAKACHEEVLEITQPRSETWSQAYSLWAYGLVVWREGDLARANSMLEESLRLKVALDDLLGSVWCLEALAFVAMAQGDANRAAILLGASAKLSGDFGTQSGTFPDLETAYDDCETAARAALGDKGFEAARKRGSDLDFQEAMAFALGERTRPAERVAAAGQVLTAREREVAELIAEGLTNKAIAARLVISQRTAQGHVENILSKLGFTSRTQVAAWVADQGQA
ncbi:MAG TPA: LuxR C-terminal-related transcriptional regulator [Nocardioidaceae bacterium]|nr:LuxR C-terminal-related transcriptional regulator [Nocardioidaceae bacterium]